MRQPSVRKLCRASNDVEVPDNDILIPSDNTPFTTDVRDRWVLFEFGPIGLGETKGRSLNNAKC
jgi:hypothetical protein